MFCSSGLYNLPHVVSINASSNQLWLPYRPCLMAVTQPPRQAASVKWAALRMLAAARACKILGEITRSLTERDHRCWGGSRDNPSYSPHGRDSLAGMGPSRDLGNQAALAMAGAALEIRSNRCPNP